MRFLKINVYPPLIWIRHSNLVLQNLAHLSVRVLWYEGVGEPDVEDVFCLWMNAALALVQIGHGAARL